MAEPLSASLGILKSSWQAIEFVRATLHARADARQLYDKVQDLSELVKKIELAIRDHDEPCDEGIVAFVQNVLRSSNHTLDELASRCRKLGDKEDTTLFARVKGSIPFTLSWPSIQKFEQQVQTSIVSMHFAICLLDRGANRTLERRISMILDMIQATIEQTANDSPSIQEGDIEHQIDSSTASELLEVYTETAAHATVEPGLSPMSLTQTCSTNTDDIPGSPMELLASQETREWGEVRRRSQSSSIGTRSTDPGSSITLIAAINEHSLDKFQQLLDEGVYLNGTDEKGFTPLMHTISQHGNSCGDCMHYLDKLLQLQCDVDASANNLTALHMAVRSKNLDAAKVLIKKGASVNSSSPHTPLSLAIERNRATFVDLLITHGADVHVSDGLGWGLVHHAVSRKSADALLVLLEKSRTMNLGIDLNAQDSVGWTPLMHLAERAHVPENIHLAKMLLDHGADVNAVDGSGNPALYYALKLHAASPQRNEFVRLLLRKKADKRLLQTRFLNQAIGRYPAFKQHLSTPNV